MCAIGLLIGLVAGSAAVVGQDVAGPALLVAAVRLAPQMNLFSLAAAYACGVALLWLRPRWRPILGLLSPVGRMALSNYVLQSVVGTLLFAG